MAGAVSFLGERDLMWESSVLGWRGEGVRQEDLMNRLSTPREVRWPLWIPMSSSEVETSILYSGRY